MDNMLYIIAGLVFIVLIAVLVMRKNKAQKPSQASNLKTDNAAPLSTHNVAKSAANQLDIDNEKKFNPIEIAQRFMDQQRYDKAIETLNRGLVEKPNDSELSLKLLAVYATIDQSDNFNKLYNAIKAHADAKTIAQADELKALLTEEQNQAAKHAQPADDNQESGFESLDFDIPTTEVEDRNSVVDASINSEAAGHTEYKSDLTDNANDFSHIEQDFNLSLNDLEEDIAEPSTNAAPVTERSSIDEETLLSATEISDEAFDFDLADLDDATIAPDTATLSNASFNDSANETALDDEFVLDLEDLQIDADNSNTSNTDNIATEAVTTEEDGLTLSIDDKDNSHALELSESDLPSTTETPVVIENSFIDDSFDDFDNFTLEDNAPEALDFKDNDTSNANMSTTASSAAPADVTFDDNTLIDDFDFDVLSDTETATTPTDSQSAYEDSATDPLAHDFGAATEAEPTEDVSSRFAADFDFVKTLDSNQVTLDLANQYVQLGEYDSAKRLLNEVISQGNSEQQSLAQALLDRTA